MDHEADLRVKDGDGPASQAHLDAIFGQFQDKDPILDFPKFQNAQPVKRGSGILSNVREERIMARRKRLEQRLARQDQKSNTEEQIEDQHEEKKTARMPSFAPVAESAKNFRRNVAKQEDVLHGFVKTVCHRRIQRRRAVRQHLALLEQRIKENKALSSQRMQAKFRKYSEIGHKTLALDELVMLLEKYRKYGQELVKSKQSFVEEIEDELKSLDDNFTRILRTYQRDIDGVRKKAWEFCTKLAAFGRKEIYELNKIVIGIEHDYTRKVNGLWEQGYAQVRAKDDAITVQREELLDEILGNMKVLRTAKLDAYMDVKMILDNDIVLMTEQLQNMRASFLVNAEKLDYNLEILQLREEESMKTKNKQKRIITKIQDELARATNELRSAEKRTRAKLVKYKNHYIEQTKELIQMHETHEESVGKEWAMFRDCWISNELAIRDTFRSLVLIDRFITEEVCNRTWSPPPLFFLSHIGPIHAPRWRQLLATWSSYYEQLQAQACATTEPMISHETAYVYQLHKQCWNILNTKSKRLSMFRSLSLVRRFHSPGTNLQNKMSSVQKAAVALPSHILGPVLRWILNHLDFFNEDYTMDVMNQLHWQDKFCFQVEAFLNEFKDLHYEDLCELAMFFLRFSRYANAKQARNEVVDVNGPEVQDMLRNVTEEELRDARIEFNDVFVALAAFMDYKETKVVHAVDYNLVKAKGKGRDPSADKEYLAQYLTAFDLEKKAIEWEQLMYGIRKEAQISDNKLKLATQTRLLRERNQRLKQIMHTQLSINLQPSPHDDYSKFIFPPLWSKMDEVARELSLEVSKKPHPVPRFKPHRRVSFDNLAIKM
ncbi:dynein regulatory complex protein 1-like [Paramacrobiotus metropolitanus]|uniref:dynein regulatory complex protein 1-like n=1 Tax=Paramacrobiotus metropolitanus TaxID=2943436 RepID=UPI00244640D8|nr:dynein regulatory complex protein 1-like [Paramacrobiotus metropolitanus]